MNKTFKDNKNNVLEWRSERADLISLEILWEKIKSCTNKAALTSLCHKELPKIL